MQCKSCEYRAQILDTNDMMFETGWNHHFTSPEVLKWKFNRRDYAAGMAERPFVVNSAVQFIISCTGRLGLGLYIH